MEKNLKNFITTVINTVDMDKEARKALLLNNSWMECVVKQIFNRLPKENIKKHLAIFAVVFPQCFMGKPEEGTVYIVSALVLAAAKEKGRTDVVAPATGHPDCVRKDGFIVSVPGFVR